MDIHQNLYFGFSRVSALVWEALSAGALPLLIQSREFARLVDPSRPDEVVARQIAEWMRAGLVKEPSVDARGGAALPILRPRQSEIRRDIDSARLRLTIHSLLISCELAIARRRVSRALRMRGLAATLFALQQIRAGDRSCTHDSPSDDAVLQIMSAYVRLRRLHGQEQDDCLIRSLFLARALRKRRIDAAVCFGVRKCPFSAHAWVEIADLVVNDIVDRVRQYVLVARF